MSMEHVAKHDFIDERLQLGESFGPCGTVFDQSDLAEQAGVAAEIRRRDENTLICVDGWWVIVIFLLGLAALIAFLVEKA